MAEHKKILGLEDTPWHIGYVKKKDDDPRRHKSRCVHLTGKNHCDFRCGDCIGSAHCGNYKEKEIVYYSDGTSQRVMPENENTKASRIVPQNEVGIGDCVEVLLVEDHEIHYLAIDSNDVNALPRAAQACIGMKIGQKFTVNGYTYRVKYIKKHFYEI